MMIYDEHQAFLFFYSHRSAVQLYLFEKKQMEKTLETNKSLSKIFEEMADFYAYLGPSQRFRSRAYSNASRLISGMNESILSFAKNKSTLDELHGIGESIAAKIQEYISSGKIALYQQLKRQVPYDLMQLMHTEGIGPSTIHAIERAFHVHSRKDLINIIHSGIKMPKGFGEKKINLLRDALHIGAKIQSKRFSFVEMIPIAEKILSFINHIPNVQKATIAGSIRRKKETIGDIDIIASCLPKYASQISDRFILYTAIKRILSKGNTKISVRLTTQDIQCDIRLVSPDEYGAALLYFTGSKEHNIKLRTIAKKRELKINEYGVFDAKGSKISGKTETEVYASLGLSFIPPEKRVGGNEMEEYKIQEGKNDLAW